MKALLALAGVTALAGSYAYFSPCIGGGGCPLSALGAKLLGCDGGACEEPAAEPRPGELAGRYLEVRNASVFAGPCHVNGESELQGERALVAWSIERGTYAGEDLAGVVVAAAVESEANLARGAERRSQAWVGAEGARRDAALAWLRASQGELLGSVLAVEEGAPTLAFEGERYRLSIPGVARVEGAAMADRECCTMPAQVAYEPLSASAEDTVVGKSDACSFEGRGGLAAWAYPEQNNAFVGAFHSVAELDACCAPSE